MSLMPRRQFLSRLVRGFAVGGGTLLATPQRAKAEPITLSGITAAALVTVLSHAAMKLADRAWRNYLQSRVIYHFALGLRNNLRAQQVRGWVDPSLNAADLWYTVRGIRFHAQIRWNQIVRVVRA